MASPVKKRPVGRNPSGYVWREGGWVSVESGEPLCYEAYVLERWERRKLQQRSAYQQRMGTVRTAVAARTKLAKNKDVWQQQQQQQETPQLTLASFIAS